jgi:hypothetical protein
MSEKEFEKQFNDLKNTNGLWWVYNCDLESIADGIIVFADEEGEKFVCHIKILTEKGREIGIEEIKNYIKTNS